jgi:hypothetical protein
MSPSISAKVTKEVVTITEIETGITIDGPGWAMGPVHYKSARISPRTFNRVDVRNDSASDINGRDVFIATSVHYTKFRKNNNSGTFASAQEVVAFINDNGVPASASAGEIRELAEGEGVLTVRPNQVVLMDNLLTPAVMRLPSVTAADVGKDVLIFWRYPTINDASGRNCYIGPDVSGGITINGVLNASATYNTETVPMTCVRAVVIGADSWVVEAPDVLSEPFTPPGLG